MAPGCAHCPAVIESLTGLLKAGKLGKLEIINIAAHPEAAVEAGTRSVPWTRIGPFELSGTLTPAELEEWIGKAGKEDALSDYLLHLLETNRFAEAAKTIGYQPELMMSLVKLLGNSETPLTARIGTGALIEEFARSDALEMTVEELIVQTTSNNTQIRIDAAHYLGLTKGATEAIETLVKLRNDPDDEMREVAEESLEQLDKQ